VIAGCNISLPTPQPAPNKSESKYVKVVEDDEPRKKKSPKTPSSNTGFKESAFEKAWEKVKGKEIVHKKDGSTYIRKAPKSGKANKRKK